MLIMTRIYLHRFISKILNLIQIKMKMKMKTIRNIPKKINKQCLSKLLRYKRLKKIKFSYRRNFKTFTKFSSTNLKIIKSIESKKLNTFQIKLTGKIPILDTSQKTVILIMVMEFICIKVAINMKESGIKIKKKEKEFTFIMFHLGKEMFIWEHGFKEKDMDKEFISIQMEMSMRENSFTTCITEMAPLSELMEKDTKDILQAIKNKEKELLLGIKEKEINILENTIMIKNAVKELIIIPVETSMREVGRMTISLEMEFSYERTEISMKDNLQNIKDKDKVLLLENKANMQEINTLAILMLTRDMAKEYTIMHMVISMKVIGLMGNSMEKVFKNIKMEICLKDITQMVKNKAKENLFGDKVHKKETNMLGNFKMTKNRAKVFITMQMEKFSKEIEQMVQSKDRAFQGQKMELRKKESSRMINLMNNSFEKRQILLYSIIKMIFVKQQCKNQELTIF